MSEQTPVYTKKDFMSDQIIRWCPGCGDYSILSQVQTVFPTLGIPREKFAVISGIGCSSRFPYYMGTFGFHTIHGRAPAFATGLKSTRPDLSVWMITGDGDALSIGGNHFIHTLRRNVDIKILLLNNRIYGLTKGQYSPTSEVGKKTKSTPMGSIDHPFVPAQLALGAGGTCVIRSVDVFAQHLRDAVTAAAHHTGTAFLEIYQNCNIFNDGAFDHFTEKEVRDDRCLFVEHGKPLVWGASKRWGLRMNGTALEIAEISHSFTEADALIHDKGNLSVAQLLAGLDPADGQPVALGVLYQTERPTYDHEFQAQVQTARARLGAGDLTQLLRGEETWTIGS
jgi:2-oxoglutarate ferredoxin oxidoreductase subunit beta